MDKDIHKEDEHFKKAYGQMEGDPSPEVWDKISNRLDRSDAIYYRNRSVTWKRTAVLLLLLLGGGMMYHFFSTGKKGSSSQVINKKQSDTRVAPLIQPYADSRQSLPPNLLHPKQTKPANPDNIASNDERSHSSASKVFTHNNHQLHLYAQGDAKTAGRMASAKAEVVNKKNDGKQKPSRINNVGIGTINEDSMNGLVGGKQSGELAEKSITGQRTLSSGRLDRTGLQPLDNDSLRMLSALPSQKLKGIDSMMTSFVDPLNHTATTPEEQVLQKHDSLHRIAFLNDSSAGKKNVVAKANKAAQIKRKSFSGYWSVIPFASADMAGYSLYNDHDHDEDDMPNRQPEHHDHRHEIEEREEHRFSFSAGALMKWQVSQKVSFRSGLVYSRVAIGIQPQTLYAIKTNSQEVNYKFISSTGYAYVKPKTGNLPAIGDSITSDYASSSLHVLAVPLSVGYTLPIGKHFFITPNVGVAANVLLSTKVRTDLNETTGKESVVINKLQGTRGAYASLLADAELHYIIRNRLNLMLLPAFRYAIDPVTKENVVKTYPYNLSLGIGVSYRF